jgi:hypothetical protein
MRFFICLFFFLVSTALGFAQDGTLSISVDKNPVRVGERFTLTITLENERGNIIPPQLSDFQILFGPSTSNSMQIINGQMSSSMSHAYVLVANQKGDFIIPEAKAKTSKAEYKSNTIKIKVIDAGAQSAQGGSSKQQQNIQSAANQNLIVNLIPNKREIFMGEPIAVDYKLFSKYGNLELVENNFPAHTGFLALDIDNENTGWEQKTELINGQRYRVATLKRQVLYPTRKGELEIRPFEVTVRANRSFFNPGIEDKAKSAPLKINVKPLPGNAPQGFNGAVGKLEFAVVADKLEVKANEPITITLKVSGTGNFKTIDSPKIYFPNDFEVYDPKITDRTRLTANGLSGSKEFEYLVIPRYGGEFTLDPIVFSYFDVKEEKYKTLSAPKFNFSVERQEDDALSSGFAAVARKDVTLLDQDIRFIKTETKFFRKGERLFGSTLYFAGFIGLPILSFLFLLGFRKFEESQADVIGNKIKRAKNMAVKRLELANKFNKEGKKESFYAELLESVYGYFSDRFVIEKAALNRETMVSALQQKNIPENLVAEANQIIDACEMARFAPSVDMTTEALYQKTLQLIVNIEDAIQK